MERGVSAEAAAIAREAQMRSEASEAARIAYVTQARSFANAAPPLSRWLPSPHLSRQSHRAFVVQLVRLGFRFRRAWSSGVWSMP